MAKTKISEFSATPGNNTDIDNINIAEGCAPSGINDAIRELMSQLKDFQTGAVGDSFNGPVGTTTAAAGAFTTLSTTGNVTLGNASSDTLNVGNGDLIKDGSGNLGLGVTPSAWDSVFKAIDTSTTASIFSAATNNNFGMNVYHNSGYKYKTTNNAAYIRITSGGAFEWNTAPSGAAGNAITFTQAMTLDSSGNLGLGVTPATTWTSAAKVMQLGGFNSIFGYSNNAFRLANNAVFNASNETYGASSLGATYYQQYNGLHSWYTAPSGTAGNVISFTQAMTLDSSGNLGLGVTPSAWASYKAFDIATQGAIASTGTQMTMFQNAYWNGSALTYKTSNAAAQYNQVNGQHQWSIAPSGTAGAAISFTQAMTLDASGNLLVGTTTGSARLNIQKASGANGILIKGDSTAACLSVESNSSTMLAAYFGTTSGGAGNISCSGTSTTYNTSSDYRLKNITGPITTSGAYIDSLNPVEGTWKIDGSTFVGLIAHEAQEASRTQVATGTKDGEEMQGMSYSSSEMIANMIAELKALRARVAALEAA